MNNSTHRPPVSDMTTGQSDELPDFKASRENQSNNVDFERQWLDDYFDGDETAFLSFYHRYRGSLYRYLLAHASGENANRLYVLSWLNFLKIAREIPRDISPGAAVFAEAHRLVLEGYRTQDKSLLLSFADGVIETVGELPSLAFHNDSDLAATKLSMLPPAWREALQIYLETGFDGESLAYALHVGRETARSRLKRAFSQWRKQWPDGNTGVEDTLLRSTQHWVFRYRSLVGIEPPDYLDARILRQADWQIRWLPRLGYQFGRYWHIALTAALTGLGVFGYLWTLTADPNFTLEIAQNSQPAVEVASQPTAAPPPKPAVSVIEAPIASQAQASAVIASAPAASSVLPDAPPPLVTEALPQEPKPKETLAKDSPAQRPASSPSATTASAITATKPRKTQAAKLPTASAAIAEPAAPGASAAYSEIITPEQGGLRPTPTPSSLPAGDKIVHREVEAAVGKIRQHQKAGRKEEADQLIERIKAEYPNYPLPRDIQ